MKSVPVPQLLCSCVCTNLPKSVVSVNLCSGGVEVQHIVSPRKSGLGKRREG